MLSSAGYCEYLISYREDSLCSYNETLRLDTQHNFYYVNVALKYIVLSAVTIKLSIIMSTQARRMFQKHRADYCFSTSNLHTHCLVQGKTNYLLLALVQI